MKSSITFLALAVSSVSAFAPSQSANKQSVTQVGLTREEILATPNTLELGEIYDPLGLSKMGGDETIAWFRHSEIKHGRVAMAAFVGWCATSGAGLRFPGELAHGLDFAAVPGNGLDAWAAVPGWGKAQLLLFAGLIEFHDELFYSVRGTHYMRGGIPGKNMVPGLYDPFNLSGGKTEAQLARGRDVEIKNGRLAMVGIAGMYFANVIAGSVPLQPTC